MEKWGKIFVISGMWNGFITRRQESTDIGLDLHAALQARGESDSSEARLSHGSTSTWLCCPIVYLCNQDASLPIRLASVYSQGLSTVQSQ